MTLIGPFGGAGDQIGVKVVLHGFDAVVELLSSNDAEVLVKQRSVQPPKTFAAGEF